MSLIHLLAYSLVVASVECVTNSKYTVFLAKHKVSTLVVFLAYFSLNLLKLLPCAVAQSVKFSFRMLCSDVLYNILAAVATVVVRRAGKFVLNTRIEQYELIAYRTEWEVFKLTAVAVETHEATLFSEYTCKLVHDTTVNATIVVLCSLTCKRHIPLAHLIVTKQVVQSKCKAALKSSR